MDLNLLKKLIKLVEQSEITDFEVAEGDLKVKISKNISQAPLNIQSFGDYSRPSGYSQSPVHIEAEHISPPAVLEKSSKLHEVKSPIVGTFYRAPAPDADPYSQVGDVVTTGSVLCIVEAMKLMNEIESDVNGKIVKILVENATPVEYNQPLFLIETN
ncbi:MAG: acetyl-CoA carboxylase biotin carboxyl carrier protein [Ignavibacteriae bacterium HGW-Ignavibacteriae-3]|nr:MAG: acetyl-CoA carboxylase biotin carboxyl carrier protein [Ignavibacteriae bacterium HGW-Ignavibacteriae-3]